MSEHKSPQVRGDYLDHADGETVCEAYVAFDASTSSRRPCVLVAHAWDGQNDVTRAEADAFARRGHVGFALDLYGKGVRGGVMDDNSHLMNPLLADRAVLRRRLLAGLEAARSHPLVDPGRIAAVGYCFGGLCVLDLARSAPSGLAGVVSIHGVLTPPELPRNPITAKVLLLHGWEDPVAPPADVLAIARELTDAGADWQLHAHGHAMHAFSYPGANMPERGILYHEAAARRSRAAMLGFLDEILDGTGG